MRHLSVLTLMFMVFIMACDRDQAPESEGQVSTSVSPAATDVPAEASATAATPIQAGDVPVEATQWLRQHAIPFDTADAGNSFDDLQPL